MTAINLRAARLDLAGTVGDDIALVITVTDDEAAAVDLSGFTIQADVYRGGVSLATLGDAVSGAENNVLTLTLTDTQTSEIGNQRDMTWSLSMTASGSTKQWVAGDFELKPPGYPGTAASTAAALTVYDAQQIALTVVGVSLAGGGGAVDSVNTQTGTVVLDPDDLDDAATTNKFATAAQLAKVDHLAVTQAVDLDAIETRVNALDAAVVLQGSWDASTGSFPGSGSAQAGDSYIVSVGGTVDGQAFVANDRIVAITDNASTSTYAANWLKLDYTDAVLSVAGLTGAITDSSLRTALALVIGTNVQAQNADLSTIAGQSNTSYGMALLELANQAALKQAVGFAVQPYTEANAASIARPITGGHVQWINTDAGTTDPANASAGDTVVKGV